MACLNPMLMAVLDVKKCNSDKFLMHEHKGWQINHDTGKAYRLISKESRNHFLEKDNNYTDFSLIEVPCGNCVQCRLDYSQQWAVRCTHEAKLYRYNYFLTLTYDDDHLKLGKFGNPTLVPDDFTQFMKSLRQKFKRELGHVGIRFLGCGEYGDLNLRPHFHIILFNCPIPDLTFDIPDGEGHIIHKKNGVGTYMMHSKFIADIWDKGFITIDDANFNTESYVSRYIMKKQKGQDSKVYTEILGIEPPFLRMSNRPGIGYNMYLANKEVYLDDPSIIVGRPKKKPLVTGLPRYYKKHLFIDHPEARDMFETSAKVSIKAHRSVISGNGSTINAQRYASEKKLISKQNAYARKL